PITLRCARLVVVPTTGPRSAALAAPHWIGSAPMPPACEVRRMCGRCGEEEAGVVEAGAEGEGSEGFGESVGVEGVGTASTDIAGPQKTQCSEGICGWQAAHRGPLGDAQHPVERQRAAAAPDEVEQQ